LDLVTLLAVFGTPVNLYDDELATQVRHWRPGPDRPAAAAELQRRQLLDHATSAALHPPIRDHVVLRAANDPATRRRLHARRDPLRGQGGSVGSGLAREPVQDPSRAAEVLTAHVHTLIGRWGGTQRYHRVSM